MVGGNTSSSYVIKVELAARGNHSAGFEASRYLYEYQNHLVRL